jgi:hypothetical protein
MENLTDDNLSAQWLWQGYVARENVTLITSQWKTGKTTLLAALLAQLKTGGELGGLEVMQGKAIVVSEESHSFWTERNSQLDLSHHILLSRPFRCCLDLKAWQELIKQVAAAHAADPVDLIVIDPLGAFLPGHSETDVTRLKPIMAGIRDLADMGLGVLLLHHPRKGASRPGQASRGSGLLTSFADIVIEMFTLRRADEDDRRRRLQAYSRHSTTSLQHVIELNAEGTHYAGLGDVNSTEFLREWPTILHLLQEAKNKLTIQDLLESWPPISQKPSNTTLWRWLERATREGLVLKRGTGQKNQPNRYWLPGKEEEWQNDPLYTPTYEEIMESVEKFAKSRFG